MTESVRELRGGNMDIDLIPKSDLGWDQEACPWNEAEQTTAHKCAVKDTSICRYFRGIRAPDTVLCAFSARSSEPSSSNTGFELTRSP